MSYDQIGNRLDQEKGVRCIADGEIIAYRLDTKYPLTHYSSGNGKFSSSFVLVRHRLQIPAKLMQPATPETAPAAPPSLVFYSLYMHLRNWKSYQDTPTLPRPRQPLRRLPNPATSYWVSTQYLKYDPAFIEPHAAALVAPEVKEGGTYIPATPIAIAAGGFETRPYINMVGIFGPNE